MGKMILVKYNLMQKFFRNHALNQANNLVKTDQFFIPDTLVHAFIVSINGPPSGTLAERDISF
jgi:hypothetical protein